MTNRILLIDVDGTFILPEWLDQLGELVFDVESHTDSIIFFSKKDDLLNLIRETNLEKPTVYLVIDSSPSPFFMIDKTHDVPLVRIPEHCSLEQINEVLTFIRSKFGKKRGLSGTSLKLPKCPDLGTERSVLPPLLGKEGLTDFPIKGENKPINFKNSQFKVFPLKTAITLAQTHPKAWCSGGNHFGNKAFNYWIRTESALKNRQPIPIDCQRWIKKREGYIARHTKDFRLAGVVAMIKWAGFVDGPNGEGNGAVDGRSLKYMLSLFEDKK